MPTQTGRLIALMLVPALFFLAGVSAGWAQPMDLTTNGAAIDIIQPSDDAGGPFGAQTLNTVDPGSCVPSDTRMCLNNGRFQVEVVWNAQDGRSGIGHLVPYGSDDSGMFWFFNESNWELLIKVLDGCSYNNRYWVFFAATTDQEFTVTVTDTLTDEQVEYTNPLKNPADAVTDTDAFATCP